MVSLLGRLQKGPVPLFPFKVVISSATWEIWAICLLFPHIIWNIFSSLEPPQYWQYPSSVLNILHSSEGGPSHYWWYPFTVLNILHSFDGIPISTEYHPQYWYLPQFLGFCQRFQKPFYDPHQQWMLIMLLSTLLIEPIGNLFVSFLLKIGRHM